MMTAKVASLGRKRLATKPIAKVCKVIGIGPKGIWKGERAAIRAAPKAIKVIDSIFFTTVNLFVFYMVTILQKKT